MKKLLIALLCLPLLFGCVTSTIIKSKVTNTADKLADRVLEADTRDERALRLAGVIAIASELMADRVTRSTPLDAPIALASLTRLEATLQQVLNQTSGLWVEADMFDVKRIIVLSFEQTLRPRVTQYLAGGFGITEIREVLSKIAKGDVMLKDLRRMFSDMHSGVISREVVWQAILNRIAKNRGRLQLIAGT